MVMTKEQDEEEEAFASTTTTNNKTLLHVFHRHVSDRPNDKIFTWVDSKGDIINTLTYKELWDTSLSVVNLLRQYNVQAGDRVMVSYPPGLDFMAGLFGCMIIRVIPCSVYPPDLRKGKARHSFEQFNNQASDAGAKVALTTAYYRRMLLAMTIKGHRTNVKWLATDKLNDDKIKIKEQTIVVNESLDEIKMSDIAFIQYSSGSTSSPKGVMISHSALKHNLDYIGSLAELNNTVKSYIIAMWLPQYHDYGLVAAYLNSVYSKKFQLISFSPFDFIRNPLLYVNIIERYQATHIAGPNFSYALLAKRMKANNNQTFNKDNVKLIHANIAAEPIAPETIQDMITIGIPEHAICPGYGIAESCACVSGIFGYHNISIIDGAVSVGDINESLSHNVRVIIVDIKNNNKVIHNDDKEMVGEICISSPSLASGYWNKPDLDYVFNTIQYDGYTYFATGDIGRIVNNKLYVHGRRKEIIIINGRNIYPTDIERTIEKEYSTNIVRPGSTVAYQYTNTSIGIVLEIRDSHCVKTITTTKSINTDLKLSPEDIRLLIRNAYNVEVNLLYFLKQGHVPKTTSGKLRRVDTKKMCEMKKWPKTAVLHYYVKGISNNNAKGIRSINNKESKAMNSHQTLISVVKSKPLLQHSSVVSPCNNPNNSIGVPFDDDKTMIDILRQHMEEKLNHTFLQWVNSKGDAIESMTYIDLWKASTLVALLLKDKGVKEGDRVMVAYPPGTAFLPGIFGCFRAKVIPCSVYPPNLKGQRAKHSFQQFNAQVSDAGAKFALTTTSFRNLMVGSNLIKYKSNIKWLATDNLKSRDKEIHVFDEVDKATMNDIAFIQYTSGSTSSPKGVVITHGSLIHNLNSIFSAHYMDTNDLIYSPVVWLPQYHDYGLIASFLMSVYSPRCPLVAFSPLDFIKKPTLWYDVIEKFGATHTAGPNFGYALLARRMKANNMYFKTTHLVRANIASEPIAPQTLQLMKDIGIPTNAINPCYGMAECCAYISSVLGDDVKIINDAVSVGDIRQSKALGFKFVIVDPDSHDILQDNCEGEIHVATPSLASGYWANSEFKIIEIDGEKYLATGDLGKICEGMLFICGRIKELIIINGKNVYPTDLERTLEEEYFSLIRPGSTVAFQHTESTVGIVLEIRDIAISKSAEIQLDSLRMMLRHAHDVEVSSIYVLRQASVPKTTSGKLCRVEAKNRSIDFTWDTSRVIFHYDRSSLSNSRQSHVKTTTSEDKKCQQFVSLVDDVQETCFDTQGTSAQEKRERKYADFESVIATILGDIDFDKTWDEVGLSSMASVDLREALEELFCIILPQDCFEEFTTPNALKTYLQTSKHGSPLLTVSKKLAKGTSLRLPWIVVDLLQLVGIIAHLMCFSVCIIPAWHVGASASTDQTNELFNLGSRWLLWFWVPLAVPTFLISFSFMVICMKWLVVGRYIAVEIDVPSISYVRWWWVDRLVHLWEFWAGRFILDTVLLNVFYWLMGTKVSMSVKLASFVREFELVEISSNAQVEHDIRCKKFGYADDNSLVLRFRPISIKKNTLIQGLVSPGATIEENASVGNCAAVPECAVVNAGRVAKGAPAFDSGLSYRNKVISKNWTLEVMKIMWLFVELYNFVALLLVAQIVFVDRLPEEWRYKRLCYWFLYILTINVLLLVETVVLKWCFVGKRREGPVSTSTIRKLLLWAADFHYRVSIPLPIALTSTYNNCLWNNFLRLMGMEIDRFSKVSLGSFAPSTMDLIEVEDSTISTVSFSVEKDDMLLKTTVRQSSMGYKVHVDCGVELSKAIVPPLTIVEQNFSHDRADMRFHISSKCKRRTNDVLLLLMSFFIIYILLCSLVPTFEVWTSVFDPQTPESAVPVLSLCIAMQTFIWIILLLVMQYLAYFGRPKGKMSQTKAGSPSWLLYFSFSWGVQTWTFLPLLSGTKYYNAVAVLLGARIKCRLICLAYRVYDFLFITFDAERPVVVDNASLNGHFVVYQELTTGPVSISGILHEETWITVGADMQMNEIGPTRAVLNAPGTNKTVHSDNTKSGVDRV